MAQTGFLLVDGNAALKRAPAVPRHWAVALVIVIVAEWIYWQGAAAAPELVVQLLRLDAFASLNLAMQASVAADLLYLLVPSAIVLALALYLSRRLDNRSAAAAGLDGGTVLMAPAWLLAAIVVNLSSIIGIALSGVAPAILAQAVAVLTPITIVQAGAEEILFRGVILASLAARYGVRTALLVSAILFGLWHVNIGMPLLHCGVMFASTFVFALAAGVLTLHYGNIGPALALHVVWNVVSYLSAASGNPGEPDFWSAWMSSTQAPWSVADILDGYVVKALVLPLLLETMIVIAVCRDTIARLARTQRPATAAA